jgi:RNA polymerase sigma-70 factor, ECF subfamily
MTLARDVVDTETFFDPSQFVRRSEVRDAEAILVQSLRMGENSGYETLVRSYGPQVMAIARRYLRSEADAADCFQDTFIAVFQNIEKFQQRSSFRQWVRGVAVKQCLMKIRKQQRRREDSIEHMLPMFNDRGKRVDVASPRQKFEIGAMLDAEKIRKLVRTNIDKLPQDHRLVLLLRDIDGYSTSETASILGIKINAVKTRLHRARSALKFMLEPQLEQTDRYVDV